MVFFADKYNLEVVQLFDLHHFSKSNPWVTDGHADSPLILTFEVLPINRLRSEIKSYKDEVVAKIIDLVPCLEQLQGSSHLK